MYKNFAYVYDLLMEDVEYENWVEYIESLWEKYNFKPKTILDLACGTGNISSLLYDLNYKVIGIDLSADMLSIAKNKSLEKNQDILFLNQNMENFNLIEKVDSIICIFDSLNYVLEIKKIEKVFSQVNKYLNLDGIFIFDINTEYKFSEILGDKSFSIIKDDLVCAWENIYDDEEKIAEYYTNFFIKDKNNLYNRFEEIHYEKSYTIEEILSSLKKAGLEILDYFDGFTFKKPNKKSERIYFVAKKIKEK